jgi:hypothetical protein
MYRPAPLQPLHPAQWGKLPFLRQIKSSPFFTKCSRFHMNGNSGQNFTTFNFFFSGGIFFFMFTTYLQLPMAGLKIKFSKNIFDWLAQSLASKGSKKHLLGQNIDISEQCKFM